MPLASYSSLSDQKTADFIASAKLNPRKQHLIANFGRLSQTLTKKTLDRYCDSSRDFKQMCAFG